MASSEVAQNRLPVVLFGIGAVKPAVYALNHHDLSPLQYGMNAASERKSDQKNGEGNQKTWHNFGLEDWRGLAHHPGYELNHLFYPKTLIDDLF